MNYPQAKTLIEALSMELKHRAEDRTNTPLNSSSIESTTCRKQDETQIDSECPF